MAGNIHPKQLVQNQVIDLGVFRSFVAAMDDTMDWLASVGESSKVFEDMMDDSRIESLIENRQDRVLWLDMSQIDGKNERLNEATRKAITYNKLQTLGSQLLNAVPKGIAMSEIVWEEENGLIVPARFIPIPRNLISFPLTGSEMMTPVFTPTG